MIPTVRVANPVHRDQFMIVNAADYREAVHGPLWSEQAPDFMGLPSAPVTTYAQSERDFAGALMLEVMELRAKTDGKEFATLSAEFRMVALRDARNEFEDQRTRWLRSNQKSHGYTIETDVPVDSLPGGEPTTPVVDVAASRAATLNGDPGPNGTPRSTELVDIDSGAEPAPPLPPLGTDGAEAPGTQASTAAQPEQPAGGAQPAWAAKATPDANALRVDKGPGSKFYVLKGKEVLSEGFTTKAKAEDEMVRLASLPAE